MSLRLRFSLAIFALLTMFGIAVLLDGTPTQPCRESTINHACQ